MFWKEFRHVCDNIYGKDDGGTYTTPWYITFVFIWIVGVLGNLINIVVYCQKTTSDRFTRIYFESRSMNLILRSLTISDFFELFALAVWGWYCGWNLRIELFFQDRDFSHPQYGAVLFLSSIYLLEVFQNISFGLNLLLTFWRYHKIVYPFNFGFRSNIRVLRTVVFFIYILGFIRGILVLCHLQIGGSNIRGQETLFKVHYRTDRVNDDFFAALFTTSSIYSFILRMVLLILLAVLSVMLIFEVLRTRRERRKHLNGRVQDPLGRINIAVVAILLLFTISEMIPIIVSYLLATIHNHSPIDKFSTLTYYVICKNVLGFVQMLVLLIKSSCSIFIYLMISFQYRKTLKLLLRRYNMDRFIPLNLL